MPISVNPVVQVLVEGTQARCRYCFLWQSVAIVNNSLTKKELSSAQSHWFVVQFQTMSSQVSSRLLEGVFIYIFEAMYDFVGLNKIAHHSSSFQCKKAQLLKRFLISLYAILVQCNLMATITILLYVFPARTTFQLFQGRRNDLFLVIFTKKRK